jgi:hypothetical protein
MNIMLTLEHLINGNTVDNPAIMRQWQLTDEANWLTVRLEQIEFFPSIFKEQQGEIVYRSAVKRLERRLAKMNQLIEEYNQDK